MLAPRFEWTVVVGVAAAGAATHAAFPEEEPAAHRVRALAVLSQHQPPPAWDVLSMYEPWREKEPQALVVPYSWEPGGVARLDVATDVHQGAIPHLSAEHAITLWDTTVSVLGWRFLEKPIGTVDEEAPTYPGKVLANAEVLGASILLLGEPLAAGVLLSQPGNLATEDLGEEVVDGRRLRKVRLVPQHPVRFYQPHVLASFVMWVDDERGVVMRTEGYDPGRERVWTAEAKEVGEVAPGKWAVLRLEERTEPGTMIRGVQKTEIINDEPPRTYRLEVPVDVRATREVTEMAVIADGVVMPKEISRYDDQGRLLMHMEFLSYEIEYEDGTVVYAEP